MMDFVSAYYVVIRQKNPSFDTVHEQRHRRRRMNKSFPELVHVIVFRHGQKGPEGDNALLTMTGLQQVASAARQYLMSDFRDCSCTLYASKLPRAAQTVAVVSGAIAPLFCPRSIAQREELGFAGLPGLDQYSDAIAKAKAKQAIGDIVTVADWMSWMPEYVAAARDRFAIALSKVAMETLQSNDRIAIVGSHSPLGELLVFDPERTPALGEAGIVHYKVKVSLETKAVKFIDSRVIFSGF